MKKILSWEILTHKPKIPDYFFILGVDENGKTLRTKRIVSVSGNVITDRDGDSYELEEASFAYIEWCRIHKYHVPTLEEPIRICSK